MIVLDTDHTLTVVMGAAVATTAPVYTATASDLQLDVGWLVVAQKPLATLTGTLTGTTPVTAVGAPAAGFVRGISVLSIYNRDSVAQTITVSVGLSPIAAFVVPAGQTLHYGAAGWQIGAANTVALAGDVTGTSTASVVSSLRNGAVSIPMSGTLASLSAAQTWSATQTFSGDIHANGVISSGSGTGRFLLYGGSNWLDGAGFEFYGDSNAAYPERSGSAALYFGSTRYSLSTAFSVSAFHGTTTPILVARWTTSSEWLPGQDNVSTLGGPSARFAQLYAATGAIDTSDETQKMNWSDLTDAELVAAEKIEAAVRWFQFADAVAEKTAAGARIHCGVGAQTVWRIMIAAGLETAPAAGEPPDIRHAFLCYDRWDGVPAQIDDKGNEVSPARPAGERYGVRYEELLLFLLAARGRRDDAKIAALTARVAALEAAGKAA